MVTPLNTAATAFLAAVILRPKRFQTKKLTKRRCILCKAEGRGKDTQQKRKPSFLSDVTVMKGMRGD